MTLTVHQYPDHVAQLGQTILIDGDPWIVKDIKPQREAGVFLCWHWEGSNQRVESNIVVLTVERFDGYPA